MGEPRIEEIPIEDGYSDGVAVVLSSARRRRERAFHAAAASMNANDAYGPLLPPETPSSPNWLDSLLSLRREFAAAANASPQIYHGLIQSKDSTPPPNETFGIFPWRIRAQSHPTLWTVAGAEYPYEHGRFFATDGQEDRLRHGLERFLNLAERAWHCISQLSPVVQAAIPAHARESWLSLVYWMAIERPTLQLRTIESSSFFELTKNGKELTPDPQVSDDGNLIFRGNPLQRFRGPALESDVFTSSIEAIDAIVRFASPGAEHSRYVFVVTKNRDSGILVPARTLLTHFDNFGLFTSEEIEELEALIKNPKVAERDIQKFFEEHAHFFRKWEHRAVHPQVHLTRYHDGPLIPDFILTDREIQHAAIIDLKLPGSKLIRRQQNRVRLADAVDEARAQLLRYRDWFRDPQNRTSLKRKIGMEIYEPNLAVVIGRCAEFLDEFERQQLSADYRDIEIVTYDDILTYARRRRLIV